MVRALPLRLDAESAGEGAGGGAVSLTKEEAAQLRVAFGALAVLAVICPPLGVVLIWLLHQEARRSKP